ncbi:hypothetical protein WN51_07599 [Melipona quadrifasciata]|uniref:Uncharacterized protein n=1 Tax=Melipona quadrifasciata TaxID=166423 RepID=A0A0N0U316_9HYME|nr:hypothetical protein WN51_07599 [Melipona quadrifasciata]
MACASERYKNNSKLTNDCDLATLTFHLFVIIGLQISMHLWKIRRVPHNAENFTEKLWHFTEKIPTCTRKKKKKKKENNRKETRSRIVLEDSK